MFLKLKNKIFAIFITWLGFAMSCTVEYGSPYAKYIINGKVADDSTNAVIENIQVITEVKYSQNEIYPFFSDTTYTDANGNFKIEYTVYDFPADSNVHIFQINDIDSTVNGFYQNKKETIFFGEPNFEGGSGWDEGTATENIEFRLIKIQK